VTAEHGFDEVMAAARLGEPWALDALYRRYAGAVAGYVRGRSPAEPEDLVSEMFVAALTRLDRFRGGESDFRAWLFTIAARRVVDDLRRRSRRVPTTGYEAAEDPRASPSAEDEGMVRRGEEWVREVLDELAPDQRDVLLLRIVGDLTIDQVAQVLGKRLGAVKALQRRGLASAEKIVRRQGVPL